MQQSTIPDWAARLGALPCEATSAGWSRWKASVATYCVAFDAINPKRNAQEWREHWADEYGKVMLRDPRDGPDRTVAEFEVIKALRGARWGARWQDTFGSAPAWMRPWTQDDTIPKTVSELLLTIRTASPIAKPWDVLAWRDNDVLFVECKAAKEKFTNPELAFIWGATKVGIPLDRFAVVRGAIRYPDRPSG